MEADHSSTDKRRSPRQKTYAKILVEGSQEPGYLRDLSREGCQLALLAAPPAGLNELMRVKVLPNPQSGVPAFDMTVEVRWTRPSPPYFLLGGSSNAVGGTEAQQALAELLRYYSS
jgi:hypothetical protein